MELLIELIRRRRLVLLVGFLVVFLMYHMIYSKSGFLMKYALVTKVEKAQNDLEVIQADRMKREHKISLLKTDNLDLDLLEEQARLQFNVKNKNEVLINE